MTARHHFDEGEPVVRPTVAVQLNSCELRWNLCGTMVKDG
jgi:hypothetical protein